MIGTTVGRYRIRAKLGGGGMGVVYEADDLELGRRVALKFLPEEKPGTSHALERFRREARAASALNHPHICTIYDIGTYDHRPYLVMERLSGQTLGHAIGQHGLPLAKAVDLALQILDALEAAHRVGIIHRDLKPSNLFVTERGEAKILDFGLAKMVTPESGEAGMADAPTVAGELTEEGRTLGTLSYMSPEQAKGKPVDARSDLFSFGVVLYEMVTGRLPFEAASAPEFFAALLKEEPVRPSRWQPGIPALYESIVLRLLEKDPERRYQSVAELRADLARLRTGSVDAATTLDGWTPPAAEPETSTPPPPPPAAPAPLPSATGPTAAVVPAPPIRGRWLLAAGLVFVAALVALGIWRWRVASAPPAEPLTVLLADSVNRTGDETFDGTLDELLTSSLNQSRRLSIFPRSRAAYTLRLMKKDPATPIDEAVGLEICQREGLGALVTASLSSLGDTYVLLVRVTDPTGKEMASARETYASAAETPSRIDAVVRTLRAQVGESASSIRSTSLPLADVSSSSLEAVKFYTLGFQHQRRGDPAQALVFFQKALEVDPSFAMAHDAVGVVYTNVADMARAQEHFAKAASLADRVGEAERHKILADYNLLLRNYDVACGHLQVLTELRSLDPISYAGLGICKSFQLDFAGAVEATRRALQMQPHPLWRANLARFELGAGQAAEALATAEALLAEDPTVAQARFIAGRAQLALGELEAAWQSFALLSGSGSGLEIEGHLGLADLELARGRSDAARRELEAAWSAASQRHNTLALGRAATNSAELALATGRRDELDRALERLGGVSHPVVSYLRVRTLARAGRPDAARAALTGLERATTDSKPDRALLAMARAEVALAAGDAVAAAREADAAWENEASVLARETQARAYAAAGRGADAIRIYEDTLARQSQRLDAYDAPGFHHVVGDRYRLAVLLDDAGEAARAKPLLESLVKLWEGADPALPAAADARRRLAKHS